MRIKINNDESMIIFSLFFLLACYANVVRSRCDSTVQKLEEAAEQKSGR